MHHRSSIESGIGYEESSGSCSAVKNFYDSFVPRIAKKVGLGPDYGMDLDDPTIELDCLDKGIMALRPPSPIQHRDKNRPKQQQQQNHNQQNYNKSQQSQRRVNNEHNQHISKKLIDHQSNSNHETFQIAEKKDPSIDELIVIVGQIKDKSSYGEKLATIMLKGLKETLPNRWYDIFIEEGLPENFVPIVRMNNDNTPFVEFLVKSEASDQFPTSQLNEYTQQHMALCQFVVKHLHGIATQQKIDQSSYSKQQITGGYKKPSQSLDQHLDVAVRSKENRNSLPTPMACSTPIAQRKMQVKRRDSLNESQRILPPRACKTAKKLTAS